MTPLFLLDMLRDLGLGQQVILALSAGFVVWYAFRALKIGRAAGGVVSQAIKYVMAVGTFAAVGIFFGWVDPLRMLGDLAAGGVALLDLVGDVLGSLWNRLTGGL